MLDQRDKPNMIQKGEGLPRTGNTSPAFQDFLVGKNEYGAYETKATRRSDGKIAGSRSGLRFAADAGEPLLGQA